jgi:hypothetical protein
MKAAATELMARRATLPGMLGQAVSQPGGDCLCQSADDPLCPPETLGKIFQLLAGAKLPPLGDGGIPGWQTWVFAEGKIRSITRPDGWSLVLVVRANTAAAQSLDQAACEFLALPPGN